LGPVDRERIEAFIESQSGMEGSEQ